MSEPYLAEIRIFGFNFPPTGWAFCQGQILPISQNTALFAIVGTTYGGNGQTNFALPNLQGSAANSVGQGAGLSPYSNGQTGGSVTVTLNSAQIPVHTHNAICNNTAGNQTTPGNGFWAPAKVGRQGASRYSSTPGTSPAMNPLALIPQGNGQPHNNMPPYLSLNFCIALQGIFPPRN